MAVLPQEESHIFSLRRTIEVYILVEAPGKVLTEATYIIETWIRLKLVGMTTLIPFYNYEKERPKSLELGDSGQQNKECKSGCKVKR